MHEALRIRRNGEVVRLAEMGFDTSDRERVRRERPEAFWVVEVPVTAVWDGIDEPAARSWYRDPEKLAARRERVRLSLEGFVNTALASTRCCGQAGSSSGGRGRRSLSSSRCRTGRRWGSEVAGCEATS